MNDTLTSLPEVLTAIAYVVLAGLGLWLVAHAMPIMGALFKPPGRRWMDQSAHICDELQQCGDRVRYLLWDLQRSHDQESGSRAARARHDVEDALSHGPKSGLIAWIQTQGYELDDTLAASVEAATSDSSISINDSVDETLMHGLARWQGRLGLLIAAGPPAGAAPTMTGAMTFLRSYSEAGMDGHVAPKMAAINDALLTTYLGCVICVMAIVLLAIVSGMYERNRQQLRQATRDLVVAYKEWLSIADDPEINKVI